MGGVVTPSTLDCKMLDWTLTKVESSHGIRENSEWWMNFVAGSGSAWCLVYEDFKL